MNSISHEFYGNPHVYEPDFIVRLCNSVTLVVEIKGQPREDTDAKHQGARRWVSAVNNWGRLGEWDFLVCREPQQLGMAFAKFLSERSDRIHATVAELQTQAESQELARLRKLGWTQTDFAAALRELLEVKETR